MNQNIVKYIKKNVLLIALVILCGFLLSLCSAGSDSDIFENENPILTPEQNQNLQKTETQTFFSDNQDNSDHFESADPELFYKTMLALVLVIVMGAAAIFLTKKLLPKIANFSGKEIRVIETVHLGPRKSVHLLEIGRRRLLIGSTNENINKLADLTEYSPDTPISENGF